MADMHNEHPASTDMSEHVRTWRLFISLIKWNSVAIAILMLLLLAFRAHNG